MRLKAGAFSRYRPRILTLVVLFVAAMVIALANLSFDIAFVGFLDLQYQSHGWPLIWHRVVRSGWEHYGCRTVGWYYSVPRLAANLAMWLVMLAALAGASEWLLRRYPRPRWSLRSMFVGVAAAAAICFWITQAIHRARLQEPVIAAMGGWGGPQASVKRSGPKWLDLVGADRFRRHIVAVSQPHLKAGDPRDEQLLRQLSRLPDLRHLSFYVDELSPVMANALRDMRRLESLDLVFDRLTLDVAPALSELRCLRSISLSVLKLTPGDGAEQRAHDCLAEIAKLPDLEAVELNYDALRAKNIACLAELKNLKWLSVHFQNYLDRPNLEERVAAIGSLTQLEWLELVQLTVSNESLARLAGLTNLRTLFLEEVVTDDRPMLSHLPQLASLEALDLSECSIDDEDLGRLAVMPCLKVLGLGHEYFREKQSITPAGLTKLASVDSLEDVELEGDIESAAGLEALLAIKRLKKLHLGEHPSEAGDCPGQLTLDDGKKLYVHDVEGFRRALQALRQSKTGIVINRSSPDYSRRGDATAPEYRYDTEPVHTSAWLPGSGDVWMTPLERAAFEKAGGRASFDGAAWPDRVDGSIVTARF